MRRRPHRTWVQNPPYRQACRVHPATDDWNATSAIWFLPYPLCGGNASPSGRRLWKLLALRSLVDRGSRCGSPRSPVCSKARSITAAAGTTCKYGRPMPRQSLPDAPANLPAPLTGQRHDGHQNHPNDSFGTGFRGCPTKYGYHERPSDPRRHRIGQLYDGANSKM